MKALEPRLARRPVLAGLAALALALPARADQSQSQGNGLRSTDARLDFTVNIDRMVYLRVGGGTSHAGTVSGAGPAANGSISAISFLLSTMGIPGVPTTFAVPGNNQAASWNGALPTYPAAAASVLPVEVRSNAGQVRISAQATTPLTSGANTIPMSDITLTSSDSANLPAPTVPDTGPGPAVNVALGGTGTAAAPSLLTYRIANWTFSFTPSGSPAAGLYSGQITFSAVAP